jgi:hypothetical protein
MVKNRIQALLARYPVPLPAVSDIFGKRGRDYLSKVQLAGAAQELLGRDLELLKVLGEEGLSSRIRSRGSNQLRRVATGHEGKDDPDLNRRARRGETKTKKQIAET